MFKKVVVIYSILILLSCSKSEDDLNKQRSVNSHTPRESFQKSSTQNAVDQNISYKLSTTIQSIDELLPINNSVFLTRNDSDGISIKKTTAITASHENVSTFTATINLLKGSEILSTYPDQPIIVTKRENQYLMQMPLAINNSHQFNQTIHGISRHNSTIFLILDPDKNIIFWENQESKKSSSIKMVYPFFLKANFLASSSKASFRASSHSIISQFDENQVRQTKFLLYKNKKNASGSVDFTIPDIILHNPQDTGKFVRISRNFPDITDINNIAVEYYQSFDDQNIKIIKFSQTDINFFTKEDRNGDALVQKNKPYLVMEYEYLYFHNDLAINKDIKDNERFILKIITPKKTNEINGGDSDHKLEIKDTDFGAFRRSVVTVSP
ncbi:MAG: hypothetical protein ACRCTJ_00255 [Brevinema sp.]